MIIVVEILRVDLMLQLKDFRVSQREESCIRVTQENSMEFLV